MTALSRLGGGIGTRGPGETKLETDRRRIRQKIHVISQEIDSIRQRRRHSRARRQKASVPLVALVGYTNAGKTTLFNLLTKESAEASDALFVTLDPLVRQVRLPDKRRLLVSDTVGFIDRLPHTLVAAFRATLEQVAEADLVLHVIDAASPERERHVEAVRRVLEEVGAANVTTLDVFNKCDLIDAAEADRLRRSRPDALCISALKRQRPRGSDRRHRREIGIGYPPRDARVRFRQRGRPRKNRAGVPARAGREPRDQRRPCRHRGRCPATRARSGESGRCPMMRGTARVCPCRGTALPCRRFMRCARTVAPPVVTPAVPRLHLPDARTARSEAGRASAPA